MVWITPNKNSWNPNDESWAKEEAYFINKEGGFVLLEPKPLDDLITDFNLGAEIYALYVG